MQSHVHTNDDLDRTAAELAPAEACSDSDDSVHDATLVRSKRDCSGCPLANVCQFAQKKGQGVVRRTSAQTDVAKDGPAQ
jgi:hypothetical protein